MPNLTQVIIQILEKNGYTVKSGEREATATKDGHTYVGRGKTAHEAVVALSLACPLKPTG